jgi:hypothetical protein
VTYPLCRDSADEQDVVDLIQDGPERILAWLSNKFPRFPDVRRCELSGTEWLKALHVIPQDFVMAVRKSGTVSELTASQEWSKTLFVNLIDQLLPSKATVAIKIKTARQVLEIGDADTVKCTWTDLVHSV